MSQAALQALIFLPFVLPICVWVAWNDMKFMKIPNKAVLALTAVFVVIGLIAVPITDYPIRLAQLGVVLAIGFVLNQLGLVGAGDAKFAAAMAPFIVLQDLGLFFILFALTLLAGFVTHRAFRRSAAWRTRTADWVSWTRSDFPMGLALGPALGFYLLVVASGAAP
ncbi:MAG: prepilin peptidase [Pseudomonadota bacterium]